MCGERWGGGSITIGESIEQLSGMQPSSFVMPPSGFMTPSKAGSRRPGYWTTHLVPADAFTALHHGWPSGCTAEHQNINTAQTQPGPQGLPTRQTGSAPLLMEDRDPSPPGRQNVNRARRCSVASNGGLIHSRTVVLILKSYHENSYHQFLASSQGGKQMSLLRGRLWEERRENRNPFCVHHLHCP